MSGKLSIPKLAAEFNVSKSSLGDHIHGRVLQGKKNRSNMLLTHSHKAKLAVYLTDVSRQGYGKSKGHKWLSKVYKGVRFNKDSILDVQTHFKPTETFQYTNFYSCHPPGVTKGFIKGEALRLLRTNSSEITFEENMKNFSTRLKNRDYPTATVEKHLSGVNFSDRKH